MQVIEFLKNLGLCQARAKEKIIPSIIFSSSKQSVAAFIGGYAEEMEAFVLAKEIQI